MTQTIILSGVGWDDFLDQVKVPASSLERVIELDHELVRRLDGVELDAGGCASLVLEAVDLITDSHPGVLTCTKTDQEAWTHG